MTHALKYVKFSKKIGFCADCWSRLPTRLCFFLFLIHAWKYVKFSHNVGFCAGCWSRLPTRLCFRASRPAYVRECARGLQLDRVCIWSNRCWKDVHHAGADIHTYVYTYIHTHTYMHTYSKHIHVMCPCMFVCLSYYSRL
jgi:hypothetical protein